MAVDRNENDDQESLSSYQKIQMQILKNDQAAEEAERQARQTSDDSNKKEEIWQPPKSPGAEYVQGNNAFQGNLFSQVDGTSPSGMASFPGSPTPPQKPLNDVGSIWTSETVKALSNSQPSNTPPAETDTKKKSSHYRQRRIDRVSFLLRDRYRRITNETNSALLVDTHTGKVVPEMVDAISAPLAAQYRTIHGTEVSKSDINRAFDHFGQFLDPWVAKVFFGRAGYDPKTRQRFIDAGPGSCLVFEFGAPFYQVVEGQPRIRPTQSLPLPVTTNIGNLHPGLVGALFDCTVLSQESDLLLIAWMILSWMPDRKQVMLELLGEPSAALEDAHKLIKNVVDPATEDWRNELPNHVKQFEDYALSHYLMSFNQVDALTSTQQKHLFSLMRGKPLDWQWKGKKVDGKITVQCPVMLNSLESVVTEPKLADATLSIEVVDEDFANSMLDQTSAQELAIIAGLLMIFGQVNAQWTRVGYDNRFNRYGGLADFCRVGELVAGCLRQDTDAFWHQFKANQQGRREFELEESPVASAVARALTDEPSGVLDLSVTDWLALLKNYRPKKEEPSDKKAVAEKEATADLWPVTTKGLAARFKLIKPLLRDVGISLTSRGQRGPRRYWRAERSASLPEDE